MLAVLRRDYPGYQDKVVGHEATFTALTDSVRGAARASTDYVGCIWALKRITGYFNDHHLGVWQSQRPTGTASATVGVGPVGGIPANDPDRPSLRIIDANTILLRLPTLEAAYAPIIDSAIASYRPWLVALPDLIVDMRGNGGGCTCSYESLTPILYSQPIHDDGTDVWASADNIVWYESWLEDSRFPADVKAHVRELLPWMRTHLNEFVEWSPDTVRMLDTVYAMPRRVAVLVDSGCGSSCEDFVMEARQSRKVTVLGTGHTAGLLDYGNVRVIWLPGWRQMLMASTRDHHTREHPLDLTGLVPDVQIPKSIKDPVAFAAGYLWSLDHGP